MKPFDLEAAKNGAPVCTRGGRKVKIICFDRKGEFPIVALVDSDDTQELTTTKINGRRSSFYGDVNDLMMYEKPEHQFKPFDKVLVRDSESSKWLGTHFSNIEEENKSYPYRCIDGGCWKYCIPYEGNEDLFRTTKSPKED